MSIEKFELNPEQRELEKALSGIAPTAPVIDRDALMFAAGEAAARAGMRQPMVWPWRLAACLGFSLSTALGILAMRGQTTSPVEMAKVAPTLPNNDSTTNAAMKSDGGMTTTLSSGAAVFETVSESSPWSYYNLRNQALNWGVNVLPTAPNGGAGATVIKEDREGKGLSFRQFIFNAGGRS